MKTCPDCGERVYNLGCVNCNEAAYIEEQERLTELSDAPPRKLTREERLQRLADSGVDTWEEYRGEK
jgi:hypothetical protein